jgi:hypothetical protein
MHGAVGAIGTEMDTGKMAPRGINSVSSRCGSWHEIPTTMLPYWKCQLFTSRTIWAFPRRRFSHQPCQVRNE